ncbi:MAG: hypothetical protein RSD36_08685 [Terrisporobacter sp.]
MRTTQEFVNIYNEYLREINTLKKQIKSIESMKRKAEKKQNFATKEEVAFLEKEELSEEDIYSCNKNKIYIFSNGDKYIGKIENNELHGNSYYVMYDDEEIIMEYIGEFKNNIREGTGQCLFDNGNKYLGYFEEDLFNGIGEMKYANKDEYIGQWQNNKKHGRGVFTWADGSRYNGEYAQGKMEGFGMCFDHTGNLIYQGEWKNNLIHGQGTYIWNEGKKYIGDFLHGKKHGEGTFYLNGELIYDGTWKFDKPSVFGRTLEELFYVKL